MSIPKALNESDRPESIQPVTSHLQSNINPQKLLSTGLMIAGGLQVLLGVACLLTPSIAAFAAEVLMGVVFLMAGLADLMFSWELRSIEGSFWRFMRATSFMAVGVVLLAWPLSGILTLALVLGVTFLMDGVFRFATSLQMQRHRGFALLDCLLGMLLGIIILSGWPGDSVFVLGIIVGLRMLMGGFLSMMIGAGIRALKPGN
ncbi:MAG: DUF308 domain-containing protein [Planctomycetaceae bacterium]|nr:DUF308 domain-containing protein [Planctomycetaceae bacterium]